MCVPPLKQTKNLKGGGLHVIHVWGKCKGGGYTGKGSKTKNQGIGGGGIMRQK